MWSFRSMLPSGTQFLVRRAEIGDAAIIARHRARMFHDMNEISDEAYAGFLAASQEWTERGLKSGEYLGWLAVPKTEPALIVAGAGVQRRQAPPHPCRPPCGGKFATGRHA